MHVYIQTTLCSPKTRSAPNHALYFAYGHLSPEGDAPLHVNHIPVGLSTKKQDEA